MALEDLHCIHFVTVVEILLGLRSPDFIPVHVDEVHSNFVAGIAHVLKIHYAPCRSVKYPVTIIAQQYAHSRYVRRKHKSRIVQAALYSHQSGRYHPTGRHGTE